MELRPYQTLAIADLRCAVREGRRRILLVAATGSGKTIIASELMRSAVERGSNVLFIAHRRELIQQASEKLYRFAVPHGIILAGEPPLTTREVQVASVQTLWSRARLPRRRWR